MKKQRDEAIIGSPAALRRKLDRAARQIRRGDVVDGEEFFAALRTLDEREPVKARPSKRQS